MPKRPLGLKIIVGLNVLSALFVLLIGLGMMGFGAFMSGLLSSMFSGLGIVFIIVGAVSLFVSYGLWNLKKWAYQFTMAIQSFNIITNLISGQFLYIVFPIIIMGYLYSIRKRFR